MYCSTCGARIPEGRSGCGTCGAPAPRPAGHALATQAGQAPAVAGAVTCPRCGFHGLGVGYFSQAAPLAGALVLALFTLPFLGAGGIVYYALRHDYRICPRCGENWGKRGARALALRPPERSSEQLAAETEAAFPADGGGIPWPAWALFAFATLFMMIGFAEPEFAMVVIGAAAAGGGVALTRRAGRNREERRQALLVALQQPVLRLAGERGGRLTVTQVATAFSWPLPRAEKVLNSLEDGLRVASDVTDEGVIVYEFRELMHAPRYAPLPSADPLLEPRTRPSGGEDTLQG
jgi:hypothetical protein